MCGDHTSWSFGDCGGSRGECIRDDSVTVSGAFNQMFVVRFDIELINGSGGGSEARVRVSEMLWFEGSV